MRWELGVISGARARVVENGVTGVSAGVGLNGRALDEPYAEAQQPGDCEAC